MIGIYHCLKDCKVWHLNSCDATQGTKPSVMAGKNLRHPNVNQLHNWAANGACSCEYSRGCYLKLLGEKVLLNACHSEYSRQGEPQRDLSNNDWDSLRRSNQKQGGARNFPLKTSFESVKSNLHSPQRIWEPDHHLKSQKTAKGAVTHLTWF